jgi:hypothetical protein
MTHWESLFSLDQLFLIYHSGLWGCIVLCLLFLFCTVYILFSLFQLVSMHVWRTWENNILRQFNVVLMKETMSVVGDFTAHERDHVRSWWLYRGSMAAGRRRWSPVYLSMTWHVVCLLMVTDSDATQCGRIHSPFHPSVPVWEVRSCDKLEELKTEYGNLIVL